MKQVRGMSFFFFESTTCLLSVAHPLSKTSGGSLERRVNLEGAEREADRGQGKKERNETEVGRCVPD